VFKPNAKRVIGPYQGFEPVAYAVDSGPEPSLDSGAGLGSGCEFKFGG